MKKIFFPLFVLLVLLAACSTEAVEPKFQKIENIVVKDLSATNVVIEGVAVIYNPNIVGITMDNVDIDIYANDILVGNVKQSNSIEIEKKSNFYLPLKVSFNPKKLYETDLNSFVNAALNSYLNKKVEMLYKGSASFKVKSLPFSIPIDYDDEILLKETEE